VTPFPVFYTLCPIQARLQWIIWPEFESLDRPATSPLIPGLLQPEAHHQLERAL
jgi:hypothetical protein